MTNCAKQRFIFVSAQRSAPILGHTLRNRAMFGSSRHPTERTAYIRHPRRFELPQIGQDRSTDNSEEFGIRLYSVSILWSLRDTKALGTTTKKGYATLACASSFLPPFSFASSASLW